MSQAAPRPITDSHEAAQTAGLVYAFTEAPGLTRRRAGKGFAYRTVAGVPVADKETLKRIRALAIPPAWTDV
jgi:DNA topoisomerase-1